MSVQCIRTPQLGQMESPQSIAIIIMMTLIVIIISSSLVENSLCLGETHSDRAKNSRTYNNNNNHRVGVSADGWWQQSEFFSTCLFVCAGVCEIRPKSSWISKRRSSDIYTCKNQSRNKFSMGPPEGHFKPLRNLRSPYISCFIFSEPCCC